MNSRLIKALKMLGKKCTATGTNVNGDNVDGVIECIAEHYAGGGAGVGGECLITPIVADRDNITSFRELETGLYTFYGYFTPYHGSDVSMSSSYPSLGSVINDGEISYVQIYFPYKNQVQYLEITDSSYERSDVRLADYGRINVAEFQKVMEYAAKYSLDYECQTVSEVLTALAEKVSLAKLTVNVTDSATGEALTYATPSITDAEIWLDGYYHLRTGAYTLKVQCNGYSTSSQTISVKSADVAAGEIVVNVALAKTAT